MSGKSALAKQLGSELRLAGYTVYAFNPTGERGYTRKDDYGCIAADFETSDPDEFADKCVEFYRTNKTKELFLIIDEVHEFFSRAGCEYLWIGTKGRHFGFNIIAITQAGQQINKTFRSQCGIVYLFKCSLSDAKFIADEQGAAELKDAPKLQPGFFYKTTINGVELHKCF